MAGYQMELDGKLKYGCLIWDDPCIHTTGWKAVGEGAAGRVNIQGTADLSSDTVYLTNMQYQMSKESGLSGNYRFKMDNYLREGIIQLAERHGIDEPRSVTELGSKIFSRCMAASRKLLSIADDEEFLPEYSLKQGYRDIIGFGRDEVFTTGMAKIINEATSYYTNCERDAWRSKENLIGVFRVPQRSHAYNVLNAALPYGDFVEVPQNELPGPKADRDVVQHWLATYGMNDGMPGLFKITCKSFEPRFNRLISFGSGAGGTDAYKRQWISTPEVVFLSAFAEIVIHEAYISKSVFRLSPALKLLERLPPQTDVSLSMGLCFENLWTGMCQKSSYRSSPPSPDKVFANPFLPFLRAQDRIELFKKALVFSEAGYEVAGYSTGALRINMRNQSPAEIYNFCRQQRVIPPFLGLEAKDLPKPEGKDPLVFLQYWYATNDMKKIMDWDKAVVDKFIQL